MSAETRGRQKPARELAARALCRYEGHPEDTQFEGKPMWESYLAEADAVLAAIDYREQECRSSDRASAGSVWCSE